MPKNSLIICLMILSTAFISSCSTSPSDLISQTFSQPPATSQQPIIGNATLNDESFWQGTPNIVWMRLTHTPLAQLETASFSDPTKAAWLQLAIISKRENNNPKQLAEQLAAWRAANPNHPGNSVFPNDASLAAVGNHALPNHIALLLPLSGPASASGKAVRDGFLGAYYASFAKTNIKQTISFYDTARNNPASLYQQAVAAGADFVVGPLLKEDVQSINNSNHFSVPTLELNYTNGTPPSNVYQFGLAQADEGEQVADKARRAGLSRAILIAPNTDWGQQQARTVISRWQSQGGIIVDKMYFSSNANFTQEVAHLLHANPVENRKNKPETSAQRRQDFDVIFLLTQPQSAREIVPLLRYYYAADIPIYATSSIYSGTQNPAKDQDLNGVNFSDIPWVLQMNQSNRLVAVGRDAYLISSQLKRLEGVSDFPIYGTTGALTLTPERHIYRYLPWTKMRDGKP